MTTSPEKLFFEHYHFNTFKKGKEVYRCVDHVDYLTGKIIKEIVKGTIIVKKNNSITVCWKYTYGHSIKKYRYQHVLSELSLTFDPNNIMKEIV